MDILEMQCVGGMIKFIWNNKYSRQHVQIKTRKSKNSRINYYHLIIEPHTIVGVMRISNPDMAFNAHFPEYYGSVFKRNIASIGSLHFPISSC